MAQKDVIFVHHPEEVVLEQQSYLWENKKKHAQKKEDN
jgi:hypothetical protein